MTKFIGNRIIKYSKYDPYPTLSENIGEILVNTKDINSFFNGSSLSNSRYTLLGLVDNNNIIKLTLEHPNFNVNIYLNDREFYNSSHSKKENYNTFLKDKGLEKYCLK